DTLSRAMTILVVCGDGADKDHPQVSVTVSGVDRAVVVGDGFHLIGARASFRLNLNYFNHGVQKKSATSASSSELRGALSPRRAKSVPASFVASSSSRKPLYANIVLFHTQKQLLPNPMVIRLVSVSDQMPLHEFHDVFRTILGWNGDLGYIVRVHGQEINSFRRKTRSKALHEFKRVFEKSRFCHISPTMFPIPASKQLGANPGPRTVSLDLPGLFKHPLSQSHGNRAP